MPPTIVHIESIDDPRLADYRDVKERQLAEGYLSPESSALGEPLPARFMAEGEVVFDMLLTSRVRVLSVLLSSHRLEAMRPKLEGLPEQTRVFVLPNAALEELVGFHLHRGLLALGARPPERTIDELFALCRPDRPLVILEDLTNHDNVGSVFRSAAALGASGVILSPRCADPLYRKSLRVSVGCVLHVPWARAAEWPGVILRAREAGIRALAMAISPEAVTLDAAAGEARASGGRVAIVLGSEGPGLTTGLLEVCDQLVIIPMAPGVDSLNVNVSAAIALSRLATPPPRPNL